MTRPLGTYQTEDQFRRAVQEYAAGRGWLFWHQRPARTVDGWRSAGEGDKGFPDNVFVRKGTVLFVEFKSETGKLSEDQVRWLSEVWGEPWEGSYAAEWGWRSDALYVGVWRPSDWDHIERVLK